MILDRKGPRCRMWDFNQGEEERRGAKRKGGGGEAGEKGGSSPPERRRAEWGQRNGENRWIKEGNEEDYSWDRTDRREEGGDTSPIHALSIAAPSCPGFGDFLAVFLYAGRFYSFDVECYYLWCEGVHIVKWLQAPSRLRSIQRNKGIEKNCQFARTLSPEPWSRLIWSVLHELSRRHGRLTY